MAVSITVPNSRVVDRSGCVQVTWMPGYPQSAYEILYRRKGEESWNTFGRVESPRTVWNWTCQFLKISLSTTIG